MVQETAHEGVYRGADDYAAIQAIEQAGVPLVLSVYLDRPAILTEVALVGPGAARQLRRPGSGPVRCHERHPEGTRQAPLRAALELAGGAGPVPGRGQDSTKPALSLRGRSGLLTDRDVLSLIKAPSGAFSIAPIDNPGLAQGVGFGHNGAPATGAVANAAGTRSQCTGDEMKFIGAHVSAAGGVENTIARAKAIGANAFALFTKNQRQWQAAPFSEGQHCAFKAACEKEGFRPEQILPTTATSSTWVILTPMPLAKSRDAFLDEMKRCEQLGLCYLNFHPGSHLKQIPRR